MFSGRKLVSEFYARGIIPGAQEGIVEAPKWDISLGGQRLTVPVMWPPGWLANLKIPSSVQITKFNNGI